MFYLYVKTHNETGLKYLGQTERNPYVYKGSGKYWKLHLKQHGSDIATEVIGAFDTLDDLAVAGRFWSEKWSVVESDEWANLAPEEGITVKSWTGKNHSETTKLKMSLAAIGNKNCVGRVLSTETRVKMSNSLLGNKRMLGKHLSEETKQKISLNHKGKLKSEETKQKLREANKGQIPWNKGKGKKIQ